MTRKSIVLLTVVGAVAIAAAGGLRDNLVDRPDERAEAVSAGPAGRDALPASIAYHYEQNMILARHGSWELLFFSRRW